MPKKKQTDIEQLEFTLPAEEKEYPIEQSELYQKILEGNKTIWTPQYCRKNGLLFHGDSLEWMRQLPKESVDMIFADPPYNIKKA